MTKLRVAAREFVDAKKIDEFIREAFPHAEYERVGGDEGLLDQDFEDLSEMVVKAIHKNLDETTVQVVLEIDSGYPYLELMQPDGQVIGFGEGFEDMEREGRERVKASYVDSEVFNALQDIQQYQPMLESALAEYKNVNTYENPMNSPALMVKDAQYMLMMIENMMKVIDLRQSTEAAEKDLSFGAGALVSASKRIADHATDMKSNLAYNYEDFVSAFSNLEYAAAIVGEAANRIVNAIGGESQ